MFELGALAHQAHLVGLRVGQLGLGLQHVRLGGDAGVEAILGDGQHALVAVHGGVQQCLLRVGLAQREVVGRQFTLRRQPRRGQVGRTGGGAGLRSADAGPQLAPHVRFPAAANVDAVLVAGGGGAAATAAGGAAGQVDAREQRGALLRDQRARLRVGGHRGGHVLVVDLDALGHLVQRGVAEQRPPRAAVQRVGRCGRGPAGGGFVGGAQRLLELRRLRRGRNLVSGAERAAAGHAGGCAGQRQGLQTEG